MCCELLKFTEVVDSEKTGQIVSYQKKWGNYEYNLNIHDKTKLKKEEKAINANKKTYKKIQSFVK